MQMLDKLIDNAVQFSSPGDTITLSRPLRRPLDPDEVLELSTDEPAPLLAARLATGTPARAELPAAELKLATTLGTNALLQRRGDGHVGEDITANVRTMRSVPLRLRGRSWPSLRWSTASARCGSPRACSSSMQR